MLDIPFLATGSLVCAAGIMTPGPNFVAVSHRAVSASRQEAFAVGLGVSLVSALWAGTAIFGLGAVFARFPWTLWVVKLSGAAYLVWFGVNLLRQSSAPFNGENIFSSDSSFFQAMRSGAFNNLSNPKAITFYASVFSSTVPSSASGATMLSMVLIVGVIATIWYGIVAFTLSIDQVGTIYRKGKSIIERAGGMFLIIFGVRQMFFD